MGIAFWVSGALLLLITAILGEKLKGKWKRFVWILFVVLLCFYTYSGINLYIEQSNMQKKFEEKFETAQKQFNEKFDSLLDVASQLLGYAKSPSNKIDNKKLGTLEKQLDAFKKSTPAETAYLRGSVSGYYNKSPVERNQPIKVMFEWINRGTGIAKNTKPYGRLYLRPDTSIDTEDSMIQTFEEEYKKHLPQYDKVENRSLLPNDPRPSVLTIEGEQFTKSIEQDLFDRRIVLYAISKVRFEDGAGQHEARLCQRLQDMPTIKTTLDKYEVVNFVVNWVDCAKYNTQIDIK